MLKKLLVLLMVFSLTACQATVPREALELSSESLQMRQVQTRYFDTKDEAEVLSASAALLQDIGFNIDKSETKLGFILGSKERDATNAGQIVGAVLIALLGGGAMPVDKTQKMRACVVTHPYGEEREKIAVRVTFQRIVWNTQGQITTKEGLSEPAMYQEFFSKLSKSLFLEAQNI
jgi:hypothetical protein